MPVHGLSAMWTLCALISSVLKITVTWCFPSSRFVVPVVTLCSIRETLSRLGTRLTSAGWQQLKVQVARLQRWFHSLALGMSWLDIGKALQASTVHHLMNKKFTSMFPIKNESDFCIQYYLLLSFYLFIWFTKLTPGHFLLYLLKTIYRLPRSARSHLWYASLH